MKYFVGGLLFSLLPIWRAAGKTQGLNLFEFLTYIGSEEHKELHIPYAEAIEKASEAYYNSL